MYLDKPITLRGSGGRRNRRRSAGRTRGSAFLVVAVLVLVNYFLFFHDASDRDGVDVAAIAELATQAAQATSPADGAGERSVDDFGDPVGRVVKGQLKRGQTMLRALGGEGIDQQSALPLVHAMQEVFDFRKAQVGDAFEAFVNDEGQVTRMSYEQSPLEIYEVTLTAEGTYEARQKKVPTRIDVAYFGCALKSSLYESIARCGESAPLAARIIDLFAWDVDFFQDVREGDEIKLIVEKVSVDGRFLKYGDVLAAEYVGKFGAHQIVAFRGEDGERGYYKPDAQSASRTFLKSPLKYSRVAAAGDGSVRQRLSGASPLVYTAQKATPVWAVGGGTVAFAGEHGALGKTVTIKHDNGYTSTYGHLGAIASSIEVGAAVTPKTVLGTVGQSGTASSPQLLFSVRKNGKLVDPLKLRFTEGEGVPAEQRERFDEEVRRALEDLDTLDVIGIHERRS